MGTRLYSPFFKADNLDIQLDLPRIKNESMGAPNVHEPVSPRTAIADGRPLTLLPVVLVVEDHEDTRGLLRYLMEKQGRVVLEAVDGNEAVSLAAKFRPNIILMDTGLPDCDGLSATRRIRELTTIRDVPIVFLSGHVRPEHREAAFAMGGNEYLSKPVSLEELERVVCKYLTSNDSKNRKI